MIDDIVRGFRACPAWLALVILAAALLLLAGCDPREGDSCTNHGEFYTHVDSNGNRVSLICKQTGLDRWTWVKA